MEPLPSTDVELLPPNPIRVETALSRYPVHRLAKHGGVAIDITEENEAGEVHTRWEVSHNSKYGQPGPLAYKLDTLIVNRRIEEAPRPIPKLIKLGSLRDICRQLDLNEGQATRNIKNALYQNSFVGITAKTTYRQANGKEKTLEAGFTRYSVIFTGEKLPDGRKADAVYIVLNDIYMQVLNGAVTRPLDYDYLKSLPPASQRFYEVLSYQMYAAIKNDRARAKLTYSEFCTYAPLIRQFNWNQVRPQLARIHAPHTKSGYIADIAFEQTTDSAGKPDWLMFYKPGPKARAEYRAFAKRGGPVILEAEPFNDDPLPQLAAPDLSPLTAELVKRGVSEATAADLVQQQLAHIIEQQIEILDFRLAGKKADKIDDPAAWLVSAIKKPHTPPKGFKTTAQRQADKEAARQAQQDAVEASRIAIQQKASKDAAKAAAEAQIKQLSPDERAALRATLLAQADEQTRQMFEHPATPTFADTMMHRMMLHHFQPSLPL